MRRLALAVVLVVAACGHAAPWSESPVDYVELYDGVTSPYELRLQARVQVYDIVPRNYVSTRWIPLAGTGSELTAVGTDSLCPEGTYSMYGKGLATRGKVTLGDGKARLELEQIGRDDKGVTGWQPFRLNGVYRVVRVNGPAAPVGLAQNPRDCTPPKPPLPPDAP